MQNVKNKKTLENTEEAINMDNAGKLATYGKQYENTTQYVLDTTMRKQWTAKTNRLWFLCGNRVKIHTKLSIRIFIS